MLAEISGFSDEMPPLAVWRMMPTGGNFLHIVPLKNEHNKIFIKTLKNKKILDRQNTWNKLEIYVWNWFMTSCSLEAWRFMSWNKSVFGGSVRVGVETVWFSVTLILNESLNWSVTLMTDWCVFGRGRCRPDAAVVFTVSPETLRCHSHIHVITVKVIYCSGSNQYERSVSVLTLF